MRKLLFMGAAIAALAVAAHAGDLALVLGNANYDRLGELKGADALIKSEDDLKQAGFSVLSKGNADAAEVRARFRDFVTEASNADTVVVALSGRFVHSGAETWFMPVDARDSTLPEAVSEALPLSAVMTVLAAHPGHAVLLLGLDDQGSAMSGLTMPGVGELTIPQGVSVLLGSPKQVTTLMSGDLTTPGAQFSRAARAAGLSVSGYLPEDMALIPADARTISAPAPVTTPGASPSAAYWDLAQSQDSIDAYQLYLNRYPNGTHAAAATARIAALMAQPALRAKVAEDAINLSRDQRSAVQQYLTILKYDPKGVDGIFGQGTRGAISRWQKSNGYDDTGYLTRDQITKLSAHGEKRAAELDIEAKARQATIDRQDRTYWEQTGKAGDEPGLRAYLKNYPDGLFADLAQQGLDKIEAARRADAQTADRADWDVARKADTIAAYREYLASRDKPVFKAEANARIANLQQNDQYSAQMNQAKVTEEALGLPAMAKNLTEQRLAQMGLKPGKVDGVFTPETRRAIRRYQEARGLTATGYLDQTTVAQLLAGAIGLQ